MLLRNSVASKRSTRHFVRRKNIGYFYEVMASPKCESWSEGISVSVIQAGACKAEGTPAGSSCPWLSGSTNDICLLLLMNVASSPRRWKDKAVWFSFITVLLITGLSICLYTFTGVCRSIYDVWLQNERTGRRRNVEEKNGYKKRKWKNE